MFISKYEKFKPIWDLPVLDCDLLTQQVGLTNPYEGETLSKW